MLKTWINTLYDILLPNQCLFCETINDNIVCTDCLTHLPFEMKISTKYNAVDQVISLIKYQENTRSMLSYIKFQGFEKIGTQLAEQIPLLFNQLPFKNCDYWIPVPLHKDKLTTRGYNQVEILFNRLLNQWNQAISTNLIERTKNTPALFGYDKKSREKILKNAFTITKYCPDLTGKHIVILDDILTSGSTLSEIATLLRTKGASKIDGLTFCY